MLVCGPLFSTDRTCLRYCHGLGYCLCTFLFALLSQTVPVAATSPGDQDLIRDRQNRLLEEQRRRLEELKDLPGKAVKPRAHRPGGQPLFPDQDIELKGADSLSATERERLLKPYIGQCLGVAQLNELLKAITDPTSRRPGHQPRLPAAAGPFQRPPASAGGGRQTRRPEGRRRQQAVRARAGHGLSGQGGESLNLREIEQMVDQLNRLPSNQAQMELAPGKPSAAAKCWSKQPQKPWRAGCRATTTARKAPASSSGAPAWNGTARWAWPIN
jgi:hemolysin activation/secretion protein